MFWRKARNRRKRRAKYILDVKVRSNYRTRERVQKLSVYLIVVVVVGMVVFGIYRVGKFSVRALFQENPKFALQQVVVETDGHLAHDQIVNLTNIKLGQSVFAADLDQVKRDLELHPLIERAEVGRELPNRIHVTIAERVPLAQICVQPFGNENKGRVDPVIFYIDKYGVVMHAFPLKGNKQLPALTGVRLNDLRAGKPVQSQQVFAALDLLKQLELSTVGVRLDPERIDLSRSDELTLLTRSGETISFDPEHISSGLRRLGVIMASAQRNQLLLRTVDLTVQQNVPVTYRQRAEANR